MQLIKSIIIICQIILFSSTANVYASSIKITPQTSRYVNSTAGTTIILNIELGNPDAVQNLVGLSFNLEWNNSDLFESAGASKGIFFGDDQLFIHQNYINKIEVGVTGISGGRSGSGVAAVCTLRVKKNTTGSTPISVNLTNVKVIDVNGSAVSFIPQNNPLIIYLIDYLPIVLTSPNGGEFFKAGSIYNINWTSKDVASIKLEYSIDNGDNWQLITDNFDAASSNYPWNVPVTPSENCRVRISSFSDNDLYDVSENVFSIYPEDQFFGPYYPDESTVALLHFDNNYLNKLNQGVQAIPHNDISFNPDPELGLNYGLRINNGGSSFSCLEIPHENSLNLTGDWTIEVWFKVSSWGSGKVQYPFFLCKTGANYFIFLRPASKSLEAGYDYDGGAEKVILPDNSINLNQWYHLAFIKNSADKTLKCILHNSQKQLVTTVTGPYNPAHIPKTNTNPILIGGSYYNGNIQFDGSIDELRISNIAREFRKLKLTSPGAGEELTAKNNYQITWTGRAIQKVKLEYSTNNGAAWISIAANINAALGSYTWKIPDINSESCKLRISDQSDLNYYNISDNVFSIAKTPEIILTSPNGGEVWQAGTQQNITWTSSQVTLVKLEYSGDNGISWNLIADSVNGALSTYNWRLPEIPSDKYIVRISYVSNAALNDISNNTFTIAIAANILLLTPNGGERWYSGTQHEIKWTSSGVENVRIKYSSNNGVNWFTVATVPAIQENYNWTIPALFSQQCKVQVLSAAESGIVDESDNAFIISPVPALSVVSPNGGEKLIVGSIEEIAWTCSHVDSIKIEYCTKGGIEWMTIVESFPADSNKYRWVIPNSLSEQCRIKITDAADTMITDISSNNFTIDILSGNTDNLNNGIPDKFTLHQNYPNPFNPQSTIRYELPEDSYVDLRIFNILGVEAAILVQEYQSAGYYHCKFDGTNFRSGVYFYKISIKPYGQNTNPISAVRKLLLLK